MRQQLFVPMQSCPHAMSLLSVGATCKQQSLPYHILSSEHWWPGLQSTTLVTMQGLRHMSKSSLMPTARTGAKPPQPVQRHNWYDTLGLLLTKPSSSPQHGVPPACSRQCQPCSASHADVGPPVALLLFMDQLGMEPVIVKGL